ncbi:MAG: class I SAM-dependent methyltransferase [Nitrospinales bacterium]
MVSLEPLMNIDKALNVEELRGRFLKHTRLAYRRLPILEKPRILDIGCGPGQQTIELARLSGGEVVGIDTDPSAVSRLQKRIDQANAGDRITVIHVSLFDNKFDDDFFDIIWEEGVLHLLDASKSFAECRRLLKPNGYLVMHETTLWFESSQKKLQDFGFKLMDEHILPKDFWWTNYGAPLEDRIRAYSSVHCDASDSKKIAEYESVVASIKGDPNRTDCGIYLVKLMVNYG